jgi:hypothetical protein
MINLSAEAHPMHLHNVEFQVGTLLVISLFLRIVILSFSNCLIESPGRAMRCTVQGGRCVWCSGQYWDAINLSAEAHPIHVHKVEFQVSRYLRTFLYLKHNFHKYPCS